MEQLRTYRQPVTIYLPPGAELRGGAWVVIDGQINSDMVSMANTPYCGIKPAGSGAELQSLGPSEACSAVLHCCCSSI